MRVRCKVLTWWYTPIARGWAMCAFLILAIGVGLAVEGVRQQDIDNQVTNKEARASVVTSGRVISVAGCNRDFRFATTIRGVLEASKTQTHRALRHGDITPARAERALRFYDNQLKRITLPDCRKALRILTDDPGRPQVIPKPLFPPEG